MMHNIGVNNLDNILFISDTASYMTNAAETLKILFQILSTSHACCITVLSKSKQIFLLYII